MATMAMIQDDALVTSISHMAKVPLERGPNPVVKIMVFHQFPHWNIRIITGYNRHFGVYPSIFPRETNPHNGPFGEA